MTILPYKIIKNVKQYYCYCKVLEGLLSQKKRNRQQRDTIELLTLLVEHWDSKHNIFGEVDPVRLLKSLMNDHKMKAKDLVELLGVSKGYVSDILNYKKGLSKEVIRKLAQKFKLSQEAFNRPYKLVSPLNTHSKKGVSAMGTHKQFKKAVS